VLGLRAVIVTAATG